MLMGDRALLEHLEELRHRFMVVIVYFLLFLGIGIIISPIIIKKVIDDLLIANVELVALSPVEFIYTQIKVGFVFSLVLISPIIIYQVIRFIRPGLRNWELNAIKYILPSFILLFVLGIMFAYTIFLKSSLFFLARLSTFADVQNMWSINKFISFILGICLALGIIFELPLVLLLLQRLKIINKNMLKKYRLHVYVFAFVIAALITPPDVVTQILIALPLIILFELSYILLT
jgi:sec-independent protein translocase protein TatC